MKKHKLPKSFIDELNQIGKSKSQPQNFVEFDASELNQVPTKKSNYKKVCSSAKFRRRKK